MKVTPPVVPVLFFPSMNGSLVPSALPGGVLLMNPGRTGQGPEGTWRPDTLPYDPRQVQAMLREYLAFGDRFAKPTDMGHFGVRGLDDFYTDSRQAIQSELMGGGKPDGDPLEAALQKAQMVLALGEMFEERVAEMRALESRVSASQANFNRALGLEPEDDEEPVVVEVGQGLAGEETVSWERLLESFLLFLPKGGGLLFSDPGIRTSLEDRGVLFDPLAQGDGATVFPGARVPDGAAVARVRPGEILSSEAAALVGDREVVLIFWNAGA